MIMDLIPYLALAMRAEARPPLPPPMTRKSVSLEMGAMTDRLVDKWREIRDRRELAVLDEGTAALRRTEKACMGNCRVERAIRS